MSSNYVKSAIYQQYLDIATTYIDIIKYIFYR